MRAFLSGAIAFVIAVGSLPGVAVAQVASVNLSGTWNWTDVSDQTGTFEGTATINHDTSSGSFTWKWTGSTTSSLYVGEGTVEGSALRLTAREGDVYTANFQGTVIDADHLEGTWNQSDGQTGTFTAERIGCTTCPVTISDLHVDLSAQETAVVEALRAEIEALADHKNALERGIEAAAVDATAALRRADRKTDRIDRAAVRIHRAGRRLLRIEARAERNADGLLNRREAARLRELFDRKHAADAEVFKLGNQLLRRLRNGRGVGTLFTEVNARLDELARLYRQILRLLPLDRPTWNDAQRVLANSRAVLLDAILERARTHADLNDARKRLLRLERRRSVADERALELAALLAAADIDVRAVTVSADGTQVFRATGSTTNHETLRRLDERIAEARQLMEELDAERGRALRAFMQAHADAVKAQRALYTEVPIPFGADVVKRLPRVVRDGLLPVGAISFGGGNGLATDATFLAIDMILAYRKGGLVGVLMEGLIKLAEEFILKPLIPDPRQTLRPGSVEEQLYRRYGAAFLGPFSIESTAQAAVERGSSSAVGAALDPLNEQLASLVFNKVGKPIVTANVEAGQRPTRWLRTRRRLERAIRGIRKMSLRLSGDRNPFKIDAIRDLTFDSVKDIGENAARRIVSTWEKDGYLRLLQEDMRARAAYAQYSVSRDVFWQAEDRYVELLARKAQLVASGLGSDTPPLTIQQSDPFDRNAQLTIDVDAVVGPVRRAPPQLIIMLASRQATPSSWHTFSINIADAPGIGDDRTVRLEVR